MNEEVLLHAGMTLLDYGILGIFTVMLIAATVYLGKSAISTKEILVEVKDILSALTAQIEAQNKRDAIYFQTIDYERNRNTTCHTETMDELRKLREEDAPKEILIA